MPSAKILAQKQAELDVLVGKLKNAHAGVLVDYSGITVEQDTKLRSSFRKSGVEYKVYKNTMTSRACDEVGYAEEGSAQGYDASCYQRKRSCSSCQNS